MPRASSEATERASTAVLCEIMTGIDVEVGIASLGGHMSDSSEAWLLTLKRLRREQNTAEAAVARKTQEHQATADAWASRVVRPAFATLAQHFNQGSDTRSLVVRPDLPQESLSRGQPRGIGVVSGSPRECPPEDYHQVGVEVISEGR